MATTINYYIHNSAGTRDWMKCSYSSSYHSNLNVIHLCSQDGCYGDTVIMNSTAVKRSDYMVYSLEVLQVVSVWVMLDRATSPSISCLPSVCVCPS